MAKPSDRATLEDRAEFMLRKVHPSQIKAGRPSKTTFLPRPADEMQLSVDRSSIVSSSDCYAAYAAMKHFHIGEGGVWAVTVGECNAHAMHCLGDPLVEGEPSGPNPAHALIDMSHLTEAAMHNAATQLYVIAKARGKLAPP